MPSPTLNTDIALFEKCRQFTKADEVKALGLYPYFKPISESEDTVVMIEGKRRIMLGSNNYLGLTHHPKVLEAASRALSVYGSGCTGSRFLNGTLDLHLQLEQALRPRVDPTDGARLELRVRELGATLDALTGGALSRRRGRRR